MKFVPTKFEDAWLIEPDRHVDERGFFARTWCRREFEERGLNPDLVQCNVSFNTKSGTLRGMHFQAAPHEEAKLVRCTRGRVIDVLVDVRPKSPSFGRWIAVELTAQNHVAVYVPPGFAHGFQTLETDCELFYQMSTSHHAASASGFHHADPDVRIDWPLPVTSISMNDEVLPSFASLVRPGDDVLIASRQSTADSE